MCYEGVFILHQGLYFRGQQSKVLILDDWSPYIRKRNRDEQIELDCSGYEIVGEGRERNTDDILSFLDLHIHLFVVDLGWYVQTA